LTVGDATERARNLAYELVDWETVLAALRAEGFSKIDCVRATVEVRQIPLQEAKKLVHGSYAWNDIRESDDSLLDSILEDAIDWGAETNPSDEK
jgi:ribosomal protein L7/L12